MRAIRGQARGQQHEEDRGDDRARPAARRLLSPDDAATYLGLGSRWAVRRLVVGGQIPVVRFAGKWRFDVRDLDAFIAAHRSPPGSDLPEAIRTPPPRGPRPGSTPRARLAPFPSRGRQFGDRSVTPRAQVLDPAGLEEGATDNQSGAPARIDSRLQASEAVVDRPRSIASGGVADDP
ncbi:MAG: helix-turn-helix domain-containing protein [Candidatus Rokubacteria bacterium]|nr:helix-turn-helix domain-containing protein [Candidatus Rokubacteria bacterium]